MNNHPTPVLRRLAALTAACFSWSFIFAAAAQAATYRTPQASGQHRLLSDKEMTQIVGATPILIGGDGGNGNYGSGGGNAGVAAGAARPWEGHVGDVNTGNGNKMTQFPLVGWVARGGLTMSYTLTHNSENTLISGNPVGAKVLSNYDIALTYPNNDPNKINILWGDGSAETFTWNGSAYAPPPGIHDHLVVNVNGNNTATSYDLTAKDQLRFHIMPFTYNNSTYIAATSISDENGNTITINRYVNGALNTIVDPTGRTITIGYSGGHRSSITDPLGRVWTLGYDGNGNLTQINYPVLNGTTYYIQAGYDAANDITSLRDRRGSTSTYA